MAKIGKRLGFRSRATYAQQTNILEQKEKVLQIEISWYEDINQKELALAQMSTPFGWEIVGEAIYVYGKPGEPYGYVPGEKFWYAHVGTKAAVEEAKKNGVTLHEWMKALVQLAEVRFHSKWTT